jgi:hypothetical protein
MTLRFACMPPRWLAVGAALFSTLGLGLFSSPYTPANVEPVATARVAPALRTARPDTLRTNATTDAPLVFSLPADLGGPPVSHYTVLQGPALCGVAGRSFTWIPNGSAPGTYDVRLQAHHADAPADTLVLRIALAR